jgi:hypothetical protein
MREGFERFLWQVCTNTLGGVLLQAREAWEY